MIQHRTDKRRLARRDFLATAAAGLAGLGLGLSPWDLRAQMPGERPPPATGVEVLDPQARIPVSLIIDDSTCLVNLNRFAIPQFKEAWGGDRYFQDWRKMPLEIPDEFVRRFGEWSMDRGVKGKYSIVPYPACLGRLDHFVPGWTRDELAASLDLVRTVMLPHWDIHPEMVTHTIVIDTKTNLPLKERSPKVMENWEWTTGRSVDELADYMRYALKILHNVGLPCEGITTPGGFGNRVLPELAQATLQSCRDVYQAEIPHYFRHMYTSGERSVAPRVEYASGLQGNDPQCVVSIIGCAGDWTGGWDNSDRGSVDKFISSDLRSGRMVEVIERGEPAIIVCHWTGIYFDGEEVGFKVLQQVVDRLHQRFDHLKWMKLSEISRYWAARELTQLSLDERVLTLHAPYACPGFTVRVKQPSPASQPQLVHGDQRQKLERRERIGQLKSGSYVAQDSATVLCFDLPKGMSRVHLA